MPHSSRPTLDHQPEIELLTCCARMQVPPETAGRIQQLVETGVDWDRVLRLTYRHKLVPLLYQTLRTTSSEAVPKRVLDALRSTTHLVFGYNMFRVHELVRLMDLFESRGAVPLAFKGPALGMIAYENLGLRAFGDLDILIRDQDLNLCKDLMIEQGYRLGIEETKTRTAGVYWFERDGIVVELHWTLLPEFFSFAPDLDSLWDRATYVALNGAPKEARVRTFSPEDLMLYLCVHGAKHRWDTLLWICDIAEMIRAQPGLDWPLVVELASSIGCERMLFMGLYLAREVFEAPLPEDVARQVDKDPAVKQLAEEAFVRAFEEKALTTQRDLVTHHVQRFAFHLKMRERMRDRAAYYLYVPRRCFQLARVALRRYLSPN